MPLFDIYIHHHGFFAPQPRYDYIEGKIDYLLDISSDVISFDHLLNYAVAFDYDYENSLVYFQTDGHSFEKGVRVLYDDQSVKEMIEVSLPFGNIHLFVDHFNVDDLIIPTSDDPVFEGSEDVSEDSEDSKDVGSDFLNDGSDDELAQFMELKKKKKRELSEIGKGKNVTKNNVGNVSEGSDSLSDNMRSLSSLSEDETYKKGYIGPPPIRKRKKRQVIYNPNKKHVGINFSPGMRFVSIEEFRKVVRDYGIAERRAVQLAVNDNARCQVICEGKCPFYIWCSKVKNSDSVEIRTLVDEHLCTKPYHNKLASVKYLTEIYGERVRSNPTWKVKEMIETIREELEIEVSRIKVIRVRKAALEGIHESLKDHYSRVRDFGYQLLLNDPRNRVDIRTTRLNETDPNKFKRIYICYHALKEGWKNGCRPILGLDGCFLKTVCGGQLLSAVGRDGNNQMFPVAYAVVESENTDSWCWFLDLLRDDLSLRDGHGYTLISDQQKGLEYAVREYLPKVEHRNCTRHLCSNFIKKFKAGNLKWAFWNVATTTYPASHQRAMKQLERISKVASEALTKRNPKTWCKAFFETTSHCDNTENNMSESFNAWIINERYLPLLNMLQEIHFKIMIRLREMRERMLASDAQICPKIKNKLDLAVTESRAWKASWDGNKTFVVKNGTRSITVDLVARNCDCRVFDLTGIPCAHAVTAIHDRREHPINYVSRYFSREMYLEAYKHSLTALKGEDFWEVHSTNEMLPPDMPKKLRGRPKKLRRREDWEGGNRNRGSQPMVQRFPSGKKQLCNLCRQPGHRRPKCPNKNGANGANDDNISTNEVPTVAQKTKRVKLPVRRPTKGIIIKEKTKVQDSVGKGKSKMVEEPKVKFRRPYLNIQSSWTVSSQITCVGSSGHSQVKKNVVQKKNDVAQGKKIAVDLVEDDDN